MIINYDIFNAILKKKLSLINNLNTMGRINNQLLKENFHKNFEKYEFVLINTSETTKTIY